jgi:hypothetical protein
MNDLRALIDFRADTPEPGPDRLDRIARRWTSASASGPRPARRPAWRPAIVGLVLAVTATAVATGAVGIRSGGPDDRGGPRATTASEFLLSAANAVERNAAPDPRPDQWVYRKTKDVRRGMDRRTGRLTEPQTIRKELWVKADATRAAIAWDNGEWHFMSNLGGGNGEPAVEVAKRLRSLPRDPDALLRLAYDENPSADGDPDRRDWNAWTYLIGILGTDETVVPADLTAAVYRAIARVPGVRLERGVADAAGRRGVALSMPWPWLADRPRSATPDPLHLMFESHIEVIVHPATGAVLGGRRLLRDGRLLGSGADLVVAVVDRPGQRP